MSPKFASDHSSSSGEPREELAAIIENSRATVDRLKRIIASQHQLLEIEKDLPDGHDGPETCQESTYTVINRLKEHLEELDSLNAELGKYINELGDNYKVLKGTQEALRESEEKLRLAIDGARMGMWDWNIESDVLVWSDRCKEIVGISKDAALNYSVFLDAIHPSDRERINRAVKEALDRREDYEVEMRIPWHDGTVHWAACRGRGLYDKAGKAVRMIGMAVDITEPKRAVEMLLVSEERLRRASRAGRIGLYEWNVDRDKVYFSPEAYELYGLAPDSMVTYEEWLPCVHPEDRGMAERRFAENQENALHESGLTSQIEYRVLHSDGAVFWLEVQSTYALEGGDIMVRGAVRDITERKRAEKELWMNKEKFRALADTSFGLIAVHNGSNLLYVNDQAVALTGYTKDELLNRSFWEIFKEDYRELIKKHAFDRLAGKPGPANYEAKILTKDGKIKWVNMTAGLFLYEDKPAIITTLFDITDSKNAERELKEAKAQAELYLDLMGHDINNFNLVARGYLELMDGMTEDEKLKELVFKPMEAIDSSSRLIQNVQKLQREKSGEYMREVLDLGALVEEVAGQMESAPDRHMRISCSAIKGVHVRADELLRDVFTNLVGNAIKHSAESPHIDILMVRQEKGCQEYCRVIIDDNGPGIPNDMKEKIFDRLSRGNTKARGSGLGLYLVKSLVESYGGRVWAEDKVKGDHTKGARFVVELPVVRGGD